MKNILPALVCISLIFLAACHKDNTSSKTDINPYTDNATNPIPPLLSAKTDGFGSSKLPLTGTPLTLPPGISMAGDVRTDLASCTGSAFYECTVDGSLSFYLSLQNDNSNPTAVIIPAGTVIPSIDTALQGGVIVQPDTIIVPPTSLLCVNINAFCLNDHRTFKEGVAFGKLLVSDNNNLRQLITILAGKQPINYDNNDVIQKAVWDVADYGSISVAGVKAINQFP